MSEARKRKNGPGDENASSSKRKGGGHPKGSEAPIRESSIRPHLPAPTRPIQPPYVFPQMSAGIPPTGSATVVPDFAIGIPGHHQPVSTPVQQHNANTLLGNSPTHGGPDTTQQPTYQPSMQSPVPGQWANSSLLANASQIMSSAAYRMPLDLNTYANNRGLDVSASPASSGNSIYQCVHSIFQRWKSPPLMQYRRYRFSNHESSPSHGTVSMFIHQVANTMG
ncbi:hypothetical protein K474DRAFT_1084672 [Panus rudis PR-1116 ss-1]|nr:hypothetical protein K474DRAFT_1084672 [Panus rudis PR-1116 ss-1]